MRNIRKLNLLCIVYICSAGSPEYSLFADAKLCVKRSLNLQIKRKKGDMFQLEKKRQQMTKHQPGEQKHILRNNNSSLKC